MIRLLNMNCQVSWFRCSNLRSHLQLPEVSSSHSMVWWTLHSYIRVLDVLTSTTGVVLVLGYSLAAWIGFASYYSTNLSFHGLSRFVCSVSGHLLCSCSRHSCENLLVGVCSPYLLHK